MVIIHGNKCHQTAVGGSYEMWTCAQCQKCQVDISYSYLKENLLWKISIAKLTDIDLVCTTAVPHTETVGVTNEAYVGNMIQTVGFT